MTIKTRSKIKLAISLAIASMSLIALSGCDASKSDSSSKNSPQQQLTQFANGLQLHYQHLDNRNDKHCSKKKAGGHCLKARLTLTPDVELSGYDWQIYFSHLRIIQSEDSTEFNIEHINGNLHRLTPTEQFTGFSEGQKKIINLRANHWQVLESDILPNYYIVSGDLKPVVIPSSKISTKQMLGLESNDFIESFDDTEKQFIRSSTDNTQWATAAVLYQNNSDTRIDVRENYRSIPSVKHAEFAKEAATVRLQKGINVDFSDIEKASVAAALMRLQRLGVEESKQGLPVSLSIKANNETAKGSYQLVIHERGIVINGNDLEGVNNGLSTIASMMSLDDHSLPVVRITDEPRYEYRGMHIDVARNFHSKELILKLLEQMAAFKFNKLHLHLADDEGWRLEIPGLEELTEVGAKRCHDLSEQHCLLPVLASGPDENSDVNGYFTIAQYKEILQAASARQIQVIPSFDMPGHARAAVVAMEARYNKYMAQEDTVKAEQFRLKDPEDTTQYRSVQYYNDNTINVCMDSTYAFVEKVISEVQQIHKDANHPLDMYHIGADETAGAWLESPICADLVAKDDGIDSIKDMNRIFIQKVSNILTEKGIATASWNDGLENLESLDMDIMPYSYNWAPQFWSAYKSAHLHANRGWPVIITSPDVTYFDVPHEADPKEPGNYWPSRHVNSRKIFDFMPDNLPVHAQIWRNNEENPFAINDKNGLLPGVKFKGIQGQLWSELVRSDEQVEYMVFPRLIALAERAWHKAQWETPYQANIGKIDQHSKVFNTAEQRQYDWQAFANTMPKAMAKLDKFDIYYRIPTVGAIVKDGLLSTNIIFPGLPTEYRLNNQGWQTYKHPITVQDSDKIEVRARSADGKRSGRILTVQ